MNNSIYRFTSFESLVNIVQNNTLTFVNHELWEDPYEGFVFKALKSVDGRLKVEQIARKLLPQDFMNIMMLDSMSNCIHGQSWTKCEESDALWRIYSYNNQSIRIEVDRDNIAKLDGISYNEIIYKDFNSLEEEISSIVEDDGKKVFVGNILLRKRTSFKHEEEVRLLTKINLEYLPNNSSNQQIEMMNQGLLTLKNKGEITEQEFQNGWKNNNNKKDIPKVVPIDFSKIPDFIKSVMVHPLSSKWYCDTVKEYCKRNKLRFIGKSKLYTLNF